MDSNQTLLPTRGSLLAIKEDLDREIQGLLSFLSQQQREQEVNVKCEDFDPSRVFSQSAKLTSIVAKRLDDFFGASGKPKDFLLDLPDSLAGEKDAAEEISKFIKEENIRLTEENEKLKEKIAILKEGEGNKKKERKINGNHNEEIVPDTAELKGLLQRLKGALSIVLEKKYPGQKDGIMEILRDIDGKSPGEWTTLSEEVCCESLIILEHLQILEKKIDLESSQVQYRLRGDLAT